MAAYPNESHVHVQYNEWENNIQLTVTKAVEDGIDAINKTEI